jgi:hypothetical protein
MLTLVYSSGSNCPELGVCYIIPRSIHLSCARLPSTRIQGRTAFSNNGYVNDLQVPGLS